jgi:hypothetical protein
LRAVSSSTGSRPAFTGKHVPALLSARILLPEARGNDMNARTILGTLAAIFVAMTAATAGSLIWLVTAEPQVLASAQVSRGVAGLALVALTRVLSVIW